MNDLLELLSIDRATALASGLARFVVILVVAYVAAKIVARVIVGLRQQLIDAMRRGAGGSDAELDKRATTLVGIIRKGTVFAIWALAIVMALRELGFDIGPILAGAGVVGLAVGFGAQNLMRDVITGLFMLVENQVRVGDVAEINGTGGLVEEVNLRTTVLRSLDGTVHVIPNGTVSMLSNKTRGFSFYVLDVGIAYKEDTDRVVEILKEIGDEMLADEEYKGDMLDRVEIFGVDKFADSAVIIKGRIKTQPIQQWKVGREFNRRMKKRFDELGIEIPFPHRSLYFGEASRPINLGLDPSTRDRIRDIVREVIADEASKRN